MGAFTRLFSRLRITSDPNVSTQTSAVIVADTTNASLVIAPNGTGALVANVPDGNTTGGNPRGTNAVDLQMSRSNLNQIASGSYSFLVGQSNSAGSAHTVVGGQSNTASSTGSVIFGRSNLSQGDDGVVFGNGNTVGSACSQSGVLSGNANTVSSARSVICGGQTNTASTGTHATVVGGQGNTSSGQHSVSGGQNNVASGGRSTAFGNTNTVSGESSLVSGLQNNVSGTRSFATGYSNTLSGSHSIAIGWGNTVSGDLSGAIGINTSASGVSSFAIGQSVSAGGNQSFAQGISSQTGTANSSAFGKASYTSLTNQQALGNNITYNGDAQTSRVIYSITTGQVSTGGTYTFTGTELIVPKNGTYSSGVTQAYLCTAKFIYGAKDKTGTVNTINNKDCFTAIYNFAAKSTVNVGALIGTPTLQLSFSDPNLASTVVSITIGASGEILFTFTPPTWTGGGTIEFRGTLHLEFTEIGLY